MIRFLDGRVVLYPGDCLEVLASLPENSVDGVCSDPPYHLTSIVDRFGSQQAKPTRAKGATGVYKRASKGFMGKAWDGGNIAFRVDTWKAVYRVLKPGGYILAFASTRGFGRMSVAIEDAGFNSHPLLSFLMRHDDAQQFLAMLTPAQLDALLRLMSHSDLGGMLGWVFGSGFPKATRLKAEEYEGWRYGGQALKPAIEPIYMGQKPFSEKTGTANVLRHGTGAINIDGSRVAGESTARSNRAEMGYHGGNVSSEYSTGSEVGRWPANLIHDGSDEVVASFPTEAGATGRASGPSLRGENVSIARGKFNGLHTNLEPPFHGDAGSASRFFYSAKADADDRISSKHPTVKPIDLMRYLVKLITPVGGTVLDPFAGTGTTGEAAVIEGFKAILIEREEEYQRDIAARMAAIYAGPEERKRMIEARKQEGKPKDFGPLFSFIEQPEGLADA